ncbi:MAG: RNA polymerase sigma factor RpoD/SigA [Halioglobus sp.]|nr:RNA polymerase sigma factor RpoD/SigA [Halioglobus sp.]
MLDTAQQQENEALEWLFAQARSFPLLDAREEAAIDGRKWRAIDRMQELMVGDAQGHAYLRHWTLQLLENPPDARSVPLRHHALLLKRELADYAPGRAGREALEALQAALDDSGNRPRQLAALRALHLPAALVAGLAELLGGEPEPRGIAAALRYWETCWPGGRGDTPQSASQSARAALLEALRTYHGARARLINHNMRLVFSVAGRFTGGTVPFRDLVQEGMFGLMRAAEKFRADRGNRFSTYAYNWIAQSSRRALADQGGIVRFPTQVTEQIGRLYRERMQTVNRTGEEPTLTELAASLDMAPDEVEGLRQLGNLGISLESPVADDSDGPTLGDNLADGPFAPTAAAAEHASLRRNLLQRVDALKPVQRTVVMRRWGLHGARAQTRAEIGQDLGVSTERVRQLEMAALEALRGDDQLRETFRDHTAQTH